LATGQGEPSDDGQKGQDLEGPGQGHGGTTPYIPQGFP